MKNSHENITLPTFEVALVQNTGNEPTHQTISLNDFIKQHNSGLILYFYPKDSTAGCTVQATDFTALADKFAQKGYTILGVSRDSIKSHHNFICKKELSIGLISDTDEKLCQHFGVIQEKMMYGKTHLGVVRSTFVFDKNGIMTASFRNIKSKEHAQTLLDIL
ncbi:peroxiredoxin [Moraxella oblonga]|uniref:peroxiredoxin n=1 Tax=Moraxella oblonga TaxID=200413 RepID=UPI000832A037|nr:peroxiredoxin [Moraxella oblonga]